MRLGIDLSYTIKMWEDYIKEIGKNKKRYIDDKKEEEFWDKIYSKRIPKKNEYRKDVIYFLKDIIEKNEIKTALELGPGWGNYTFDIANMIKNLDVCDISKSSLIYLEEEANKRNIKNINYHHSNFNDFNYKNYDLIFGFNSMYRVKDIVMFLSKLQNSSDKLVVIGINTSYEAFYNKIIQEELNLKIVGMGNDYILLTNILYTMGIDVNQAMLPINRKFVFKNLEEVKAHETFRINLDRLNKSQINKIDKILYDNLKKENDEFILEIKNYMAIVFWDTRIVKNRSLYKHI